MAARIFLALIALVAIMWFLSWYNRATPQQRNKSLRSILLYGAGAAILLLVVTGRIPWLFALFSAAVPWVNRAMAAKRMWTTFTGKKNTDGNPHQDAHNEQKKVSDVLSREQALEVLGLESDASRQDIIDAHRKLMQKIHPDRGGTDYLAARINQAKDLLLDE